MDFSEAERRFDDLKRQHEAGTISSAEFDDRLEQLKVKDGDGRWWVMDRQGSSWYYWDGSVWQQGRSIRPDNTDGPSRSDSRGALWVGLGALCALISLIIVPLVFGGLGFFFGYLAKRGGNDVGGVAVMVGSVVCAVLGVLIGVIIGGAYA